MARFLRTHALTLLLVALAALGTGWVVKTRKPPGAMTVLEAQAMDMTAMQAPPGFMPVSVESLRPGPLQGTLTCTATVESRDGEDVVARLPGRVLDVPVVPGERVVAGQVLVRMDPVDRLVLAGEGDAPLDIRAAQAEVEGSQVRLERAQARLALRRSEMPALRADVQAAEVRLRQEALDLARAAKLFGQAALPQDDLQDAEAAHDEARAHLKARQAELERASAALERTRNDVAAAGRDVARARAEADAARAAVVRALAVRSAPATDRGYVELTALGAGEVAQTFVKTGSIVLPGAPLVEIRRQDRLRLRATLAADSVARMAPGARASVRSASGGPRLAAKVTQLISAGSAMDGSATIEAELTGPPNLPDGLIPGDLVELEVQLSQPVTALSVPRKALRRDLEGRDFVWLVAQAPPSPGAVAWTCPMHPQVHSPTPGLCPDCRMDLVPEGLSGGLQARKQVVEPGEPVGDRVILRSGLQAGRVVVEGYEDLREGMAVVIVPWRPDGPVSVAAVRTGPAPPSPASPPGDGSYSCPMHPEVRSPEPGICPKCNMRLER